MDGETAGIELGSYPTGHINGEEVYGPNQRTWSNVDRGFAEDSEPSDHMRHDARLADSRSRPLTVTALDETRETV